MDTVLVKVRKGYKYRLYDNRKTDKQLHRQIDIAASIWNHALALQKRYYRLTGKYIPPNILKKHITKLYNRCPRFAFWKVLPSQARQDVIERLDRAYQKFFARQGRLPRFK